MEQSKKLQRKEEAGLTGQTGKRRGGLRMQFTKRKKIFVLVGMFVLLAVTGYLNFALNGSTATVGGGTVGSQDLFLMFRETRTAERDANKAILQNIAAAESGYTDEAKTQAAAQLLELMQTINFEDTCEGLILRHGYANVIVTKTNDNVNILVKNAAQLEEWEVANVLKVIQDNTTGEFDVEKVFLSIIE